VLDAGGSIDAPQLAGVALQPPPQPKAVDQGALFAARRAALEVLLMLFVRHCDKVVYLARPPAFKRDQQQQQQRDEEQQQWLGGVVQQLRVLQQAKRLLQHQRLQQSGDAATEAAPVLHLVLLGEAEGPAAERLQQLRAAADHLLSSSHDPAGQRLFVWGGAHVCRPASYGLHAVADAVSSAADGGGGGFDESLMDLDLSSSCGEDQIRQLLSHITPQISSSSSSRIGDANAPAGTKWVWDSGSEMAASWAEFQRLLHSGVAPTTAPQPVNTVQQAAASSGGGRQVAPSSIEGAVGSHGSRDDDAEGSDEGACSDDSWGGAGLSSEHGSESEEASPLHPRRTQKREQRHQQQREQHHQQQQQHPGQHHQHHQHHQQQQGDISRHASMGAAELLSVFVDGPWFQSVRQCSVAAHFGMRTYLAVSCGWRGGVRGDSACTCV